MDVNTGLIVASVLTGRDADDLSQVGTLPDQIEHAIGTVTTDGAFDGKPTCDTITKRDSPINVVMPQRATV